LRAQTNPDDASCQPNSPWLGVTHPGNDDNMDHMFESEHEAATAPLAASNGSQNIFFPRIKIFFVNNDGVFVV
jgi:hypothetical protein